MLHMNCILCLLIYIQLCGSSASFTVSLTRVARTQIDGSVKCEFCSTVCACLVLLLGEVNRIFTLHLEMHCIWNNMRDLFSITQPIYIEHLSISNLL